MSWTFNKPVPAASGSPHGAAGRTVPDHVPPGTAHIRHIMDEALRAARAGEMDAAFIDLAHGIVVALEKRERVPLEDVRQWFREVTSAAGVW